MRLKALLPVVVLVLATSAAHANVLEVPAKNAEVSGVLYASGWKCPPFGDITFEFDDLAPLPAATGLSRDDTKSACGNAGRNGFMAQFNFGLLGDGRHTVRVLDDGVEFARASFTVTTFGTRFLRGASGTYELPDFPEKGATTVVEWMQGLQSFTVVDYEPADVTPGPTPRPTPRPTPAPTPAACPVNGPIRDLRNDCSHIGYGYSRNGVVAAMSTNGDVVAICMTGDGVDVVCQGGPVTSRTAFLLTGANINGGPLVPLGAGSQGSIRNNGQTLDFTVILGGDVFIFNGFSFFGTEPIGASAAATSATLETFLADALLSLEAITDGTAPSAASSGDEGEVRDALGRLEGSGARP